MSIDLIYSTNVSVSPATNSRITVNPGFRNLEVANVSGAGQVWFDIDDGGDAVATSNGANLFHLPASVGANRVFTYDPSDSAFSATKQVAVIATATNTVAVTAW